VTDVSSDAIRCYERSGPAPSISQVKAGGQITWSVAPSIYHPGALSAYMAKVPSGQTASTWDGKGAVWFKVFQDMPTTSGGQYNWPSNGEFFITFFVSGFYKEGRGREIGRERGRVRHNKEKESGRVKDGYRFYGRVFGYIC
jgi:hypothetical protein